MIKKISKHSQREKDTMYRKTKIRITAGFSAEPKQNRRNIKTLNTLK